MGVCSNMSEILGNHMHVTQMSRLLICISSSRCTSGHRKQLSAPPGTQNTNADNLPIYQQGQPWAQPFPLTPGRAALSDLRPSSHPTTVTHMHRPSQAPVPQAQVKRSQGPRTIFTVVWSASRLCNYDKTMLLFGSFLSFALSSVADEVWNVVYPDKSCGFTAHFHSTYNFRMISSVCSQNSDYFNVLFKLLMCNKW